MSARQQALFPVASPVEFTDADSTRLVELWPDGSWTVKTREDRWATWSAPVELRCIPIGGAA